MLTSVLLNNIHQSNQKTLFRTNSKHATLNTFFDQFILNNAVLRHAEEKDLTHSLYLPGN